MVSLPGFFFSLFSFLLIFTIPYQPLLILVEVNKFSENYILKRAVPLYKILSDETIEDGKLGCKRFKLTGKHYFAGIYEGREANEELWLEVQQYIYDHYDMEYLQNVYIAGDGAPWIVAGCGILEKSKFVLDKFHLWKCI